MVNYTDRERGAMSRPDRRLCTSTQRPMRPCSRSTEANQASSTSSRTTALSRSPKPSASLALIPAFAWETEDGPCQEHDGTSTAPCCGCRPLLTRLPVPRETQETVNLNVERS